MIVIGAAGGMGLWAARHWFAELKDVARVTLCDVEPLSASARDAVSSAPADVDFVRAEYGPNGMSFADWSLIKSSIDPGTEPLNAAPRLADIDIVALGVPVSAIGDVMDALEGRIAGDAWLIDMASVKGPPVEQMLEKTDAGVSVVGTHPLFGITGDSIAGRTVVLVPSGRDDGELIAWLDRGLHSLGAVAVHTTAERHDRYMLIAQTMTHFALLTFGEAVTRALRDDESLGELRSLGTPPYLAMSNVTGRLLTQNHRLYAAIQQSEDADGIRGIFVEAAKNLADSFRGGSLDDIEAEIDGLATRFGSDELAIATRLSEQMFHGDAERGDGRD